MIREKRKMKKLFSVLLIVLLLAMSLSACGDSGSSTTEQAEPLDLTGLWIQEDTEDTYLAATIQEDTIGVFIFLEGDDEPWTYWVGTYDAPTDSSDQYTWTSTSTYGGSGLLASGDDTKEFSYKKGELKFEMTIQGDTGTITLVKGEWDTSNIPESAFSSVNTNTTDVLPLEIKDTKWVVSDSGYLEYYVTLFNPNSNIAVEYPSFRITARDAADKVLGTEDQGCAIIYPQQELTYGGMAFSVDETPEAVDFEALEADEYNLKKVDPDAYTPMEAVDVEVKSDKIVGEVNNPNDEDYDSVAVTLILKNKKGKILGIDTTYVDDVKANGKTPFDTSIWGYDGVASCDAYVCEWM